MNTARCSAPPVCLRDRPEAVDHLAPARASVPRLEQHAIDQLRERHVRVHKGRRRPRLNAPGEVRPRQEPAPRDRDEARIGPEPRERQRHVDHCQAATDQQYGPFAGGGDPLELTRRPRIADEARVSRELLVTGRCCSGQVPKGEHRDIGLDRAAAGQPERDMVMRRLDRRDLGDEPLQRKRRGGTPLRRSEYGAEVATVLGPRSVGIGLARRSAELFAPVDEVIGRVGKRRHARGCDVESVAWIERRVGDAAEGLAGIEQHRAKPGAGRDTGVQQLRGEQHPAGPRADNCDGRTACGVARKLQLGGAPQHCPAAADSAWQPAFCSLIRGELVHILDKLDAAWRPVNEQKNDRK
jgi:hypothetical protein